MVYNKYLTIYDDTESSRQSRSRSGGNNNNHFHQYHYEYLTRQPSTMTPTSYTSSNVYQPRSSSSSDTKRYTSHLNLHTKGSNGTSGTFYAPWLTSACIRRSSSANSPTKAHQHHQRTGMSRKLNYLDAKYGSSNGGNGRSGIFKMKPEPIIEETYTSYPIYAVSDPNGDATSAPVTKSSSKTEVSESRSAASSYGYYDVEIPIQRARGTYHFDGATASYQYHEPRSAARVHNSSTVYGTSSSPATYSAQPQSSSLKLDVEISNNEPKTSKKNKSYEVRVVI